MLETERLLIRRFTPNDLEKLIQTRSDPEVSKYLGGQELQNSVALKKRLDFYLDCYEKFGFGMCAMIWKLTGEMIGSSGIQPLEDTGEIEVGYSVVKEFWRQGIGFECARAWLEYGFENAALERIVAVTYPGNIGSRRILEKCGMKYEKIETHYNFECVFYGISREEFFSLKT
jgi:ribosomal-protein-alanine N-acetyltransferase